MKYRGCWVWGRATANFDTLLQRFTVILLYIGDCVLIWFASDAAHFCVHPYNICGEASAVLYGEEQRF